MTNDLLRAMAEHRTIRKYATGELDDARVREVVEAAQCAATSSNLQGYALIRIRNAVARERLEELTGGQHQVSSAGAFFVICADQRRHRMVAQSQSRAHTANLETFLIGTIDASLFAQNLALGFESIGLGTCFIGGLRTKLPEVDALLEIPDDVFPLFGLCVGVAAEDPGVRPRLPVGAVLMEERYSPDESSRKNIAKYDEAMREYYAQRGQPGHDWSGGTARRLESPQRAHLHDYYERKGARLE